MEEINSELLFDKEVIHVTQIAADSSHPRRNSASRSRRVPSLMSFLWGEAPEQIRLSAFKQVMKQAS